MTSLILFLAAEQDASRPPNLLNGMLVPMTLMFVIFYFLLIRPQKKRQQELQKQIDSMQIGDAVVTSGGIHGIVANKAEHTITVKVADNVKIKFDKVAVVRVVSKDRVTSSSAIPGEGESKES